MIVEVFLSLALICIDKDCHPALIGEKTPVGEFSLVQRLVKDPFYAGSVLQFKETEKEIFSIHRIWNGRPSEKRSQRLQSKDVDKRIITSGCINVSDYVYQLLLTCCQNEKITIYP